MIVAGVVLLVAIISSVLWWVHADAFETTDDAQVDAHVTPIAARVGGTAMNVPVNDNQEVEAGAVLLSEPDGGTLTELKLAVAALSLMPGC